MCIRDSNYTTGLKDNLRYANDNISKKYGTPQLDCVLDTNKRQDFNGEARRRRSGSPISHMQHRNLIDSMKSRRNSNTTNSTFNYKSKHYEMPYNDMMKNENKNKNAQSMHSSINGANNESSAGEVMLKTDYVPFQHSPVKSYTPDGKEGIDTFKSNDSNEYSNFEEQARTNLQLSRDILMGEPGDMVDLSSFVTSPRKASNETGDLAFNLSQDDRYDTNNTSKTIHANTSATTSNESWCISDNALGKQGQDSEVRSKRKSKLGLFRHIFSRK